MNDTIFHRIDETLEKFRDAKPGDIRYEKGDRCQKYTGGHSGPKLWPKLIPKFIIHILVFYYNINIESPKE